MINIEMISMGVAIICYIAIIKSLWDLKSIVGSMKVRTGKMIRICDHMIAICEDAGKTRKRLIRSKWGRK